MHASAANKYAPTLSWSFSSKFHCFLFSCSIAWCASIRFFISCFSELIVAIVRD